MFFAIGDHWSFNTSNKHTAKPSILIIFISSFVCLFVSTANAAQPAIVNVHLNPGISAVHYSDIKRQAVWRIVENSKMIKIGITSAGQQDQTFTSDKLYIHWFSNNINSLSSQFAEVELQDIEQWLTVRVNAGMLVVMSDAKIQIKGYDTDNTLLQSPFIHSAFSHQELNFQLYNKSVDNNNLLIRLQLHYPNQRENNESISIKFFNDKNILLNHQVIKDIINKHQKYRSLSLSKTGFTTHNSIKYYFYLPKEVSRVIIKSKSNILIGLQQGNPNSLRINHKFSSHSVKNWWTLLPENDVSRRYSIYTNTNGYLFNHTQQSSQNIIHVDNVLLIKNSKGLLALEPSNENHYDENKFSKIPIKESIIIDTRKRPYISPTLLIENKTISQSFIKIFINNDLVYENTLKKYFSKRKLPLFMPGSYKLSIETNEKNTVYINHYTDQYNKKYNSFRVYPIKDQTIIKYKKTKNTSPYIKLNYFSNSQSALQITITNINNNKNKKFYSAMNYWSYDYYNLVTKPKRLTSTIKLENKKSIKYLSRFYLPIKSSDIDENNTIQLNKKSLTRDYISVQSIRK